MKDFEWSLLLRCIHSFCYSYFLQFDLNHGLVIQDPAASEDSNKNTAQYMCTITHTVDNAMQMLLVPAVIKCTVCDTEGVGGFPLP